jgi:ribosomal protein S18 acetylase RimI-like enzyme
MDPATRARDFLRSLDELASTRIEDLGYGTAYFNEQLPRVHERTNFVRVSSWLDAAKLAGLLQETESSQQKAGLAHRKLIFEEARTDKLAPFLRPMRWEVLPHALLVYNGSGTWAPPPGHSITELNGDRLRDVRRQHLELDPNARYPETIEQLLARDDKLAETIEIRWFAAYDGSQPVSLCGIYSDGHTAQLAGLSTLGRFRKRRHGHAALTAALQAASAKNDVVMGVAPTGGWTRGWFERLGFEAVAERATALKTVGATATRV